MGLFTVLCLIFVVSRITTTSAQFNCGQSKIELTSTENTYTLSSPSDYGQDTYPPNADCTWTIKAPSYDKSVELTFTTFNTHGSPTCDASTDDVLEIYDSNDKTDMIGKYCGSYLPAKVVSTFKYLTIVFKSTKRPLVSKKGFSLQYKAVNRPVGYKYGCSPFNLEFNNKHINLDGSSTTKYIKSPYYPNRYPSGIECIWILSAGIWDNKIKLKIKNVKIFNSKTPSSCSSSDIDSLAVYDGYGTSATKLNSYCSSSFSSTTITSTGRDLTVRFKSNLDNYFIGTTAGFEAEFSQIDDVSSSRTSVIVGSIIGFICVVGLIVCCVCIVKRRGTRGYVQRGPAVTTMQTTTTTAQQYPMQPQAGYQPAGNYPAAGKVHYPPPGQGSYPPPQGSYPPPPPQGSYPPPAGQGGYPPPLQTSPYPTSSDPPPQYPGPPAYPPQDNPPYNPQGGPQQPPYPPPPDKASAPPQF